MNHERDDVIKWLLQGEPWVRYRTLRDILDKDERDNMVIATKSALSKHPLIEKIFDGQNVGGYWGKPKDIHTWWPKKNTTFWILSVLADFGFTREDERIAKACEYVFGIQLDNGGFGWDPPTKAYDCHTAILTEALARLGYVSDPRLKNAYKWLISRQRLDGGFWCKNTAQPGGPREDEPSCAMATMFLLGALAHNNELLNSEVTRRGVNFLIRCWEKRGKIKYAGHDSQVGRDFEKLKYPFTDYRILKYLDVVSQFYFFAKDSRVKEIFDLLLSKRDVRGRFTPESIHKVWCDFDFGQKDKPSRWITFLVYRIKKRLNVGPSTPLRLIMIDPNFIGALKKIYKALNKADIKWAITGSLGFAIQGISVQPNDIDIQTDKKGAYRIEQLFSEYVEEAVTFSTSENIRSHFGVLKIDNVKVEIMGDIEKRRVDGTWDEPLDLVRHIHLVDFYGMRIPVLTLDYEYQAYLKLGRVKKAEIIKRWLEGRRDNNE